MKKNSFYFGLVLVSALLLGLTFALIGPSDEKLTEKSYLEAGEYHLVENILKQFVSSREENLFFSQDQNLSPQSPDLSIIEDNSLASVSSPQLVSPKVLGAIGAGESYSETPHKVQEYKVKPGDSLWSIAQQFDISMETIQWANDINGSTIVPGEKLIILPVDGVMHSAESGDTVSEIAETYDADKEDIIAFNDLPEEGNIYIGDVLIIPGGEMPSNPGIYRQVPLASSYFIYPTEGMVSQGAHWPPRYNAVDIANQCGSSVYSVAPGTVYQIGYAWPGGRFVKIKHSLSSGSVVSYYGHLSKVLVREQQRVIQGQKIGLTGYTGYTVPRGPAGCHLHFDVFGARNPFLYSKGTTISY